MTKKNKLPGRLIIISGPSCVGKDSVISRIRFLNKSLSYSISFTTRSIRPGEKDGVSYHFVSVEDFERKIANNEFLEYAKYCDNYYGTLGKPVLSAINSGRDIVLKIEVEGAEKVRSLGLNGLSIFISHPSFDELKERISVRGVGTEDDVSKRLERVNYEMEKSKDYDFVVVNDLVDRCAHEILDILGY